MEKLLLRKGEPYEVTDLITVKNLKIGEIAEFGEEKYWSLISHLCSTSFDYRLALEEAGIDYLTIDDWHMFINTHYSYNYEDTKILIPNIDIASLQIYVKEEKEQQELTEQTEQQEGKDESLKNDTLENKELVLVNDKGQIVFDELAYTKMVDFIRQTHSLKRNFKIPGNQAARDVYMRDAREAQMYADRQKFESNLDPLISALCNVNGFDYNYETIWDVNIYNFLDSVQRIQKIQSANHLMGGIYGGMLDISKMNKGQLSKDLNWLGELK